MKYSVLLPLLSSVATAQYGGSGDSGSSSSSSSSSSGGSSTSTATSSTFTSTTGVITHAVAVGQSGVTFTPSSLTAKVGEAVEFLFYPAIHSVNQATFDKPCAPANGSGFASGVFRTTGGANATTFTILINDTSPVWYYCGYLDHCQLGMNGVINPPDYNRTNSSSSDGSQTLAQFNTAAALVANTTRVSGVQGGTVGAAASAASASGTAGSTTSASTTTATSKPNDANELGAWIGSVAGAVGVIFAGLIL